MTNRLKPLKAILCGITITAVSIGTSAANELKKVATIDMQRLFSEYHLTKGSQAKVKINGDTVQKENAEKLQELSKLAEKIKKITKQIEDPVTSANGKKKLIAEHKELAAKGQALEANRRDWLNRRKKALSENIASETGKLMKDIQAQVNAYAKNNELDMIVDTSARGASGNPFISFVNSDFDATSEILAVLNKDVAAPKVEAPAAPTPAPTPAAPAPAAPAPTPAAPAAK